MNDAKVGDNNKGNVNCGGVQIIVVYQTPKQNEISLSDIEDIVSNINSSYSSSFLQEALEKYGPSSAIHTFITSNLTLDNSISCLNYYRILSEYGILDKDSVYPVLYVEKGKKCYLTFRKILVSLANNDRSQYYLYCLESTEKLFSDLQINYSSKIINSTFSENYQEREIIDLMVEQALKDDDVSLMKKILKECNRMFVKNAVMKSISIISESWKVWTQNNIDHDPNMHIKPKSDDYYFYFHRTKVLWILFEEKIIDESSRHTWLGKKTDASRIYEQIKKN
jgi:hypothetical protein